MVGNDVEDKEAGKVDSRLKGRPVMSSSNFSQRWRESGWLEVLSALPSVLRPPPFTLPHESSDSLNCSVLKQLYVLDTTDPYYASLSLYRFIGLVSVLFKSENSELQKQACPRQVAELGFIQVLGLKAWGVALFSFTTYSFKSLSFRVQNISWKFIA